jgi:hypothetical protein
MKLRSAFSVLAIAAALTACSSSSTGGSPSVANTGPATGAGGSTAAVAPGGGSGGSVAAFCTKLTTANNGLGGLLNTGNAGDFNALKTALGQAVAKFQDLDSSAPAQVKPAIDDIIGGLQGAQQAVSDPSNPDVSKLQALATKLPADANTLATYIASNCH